MIDQRHDADAEWLRALEYVFRYGTVSKPRGMDVYEVIGYQSVVDMNCPIIFNPDRKLGYKFMAAEAAWILSGRDDVKSISPFSKEISKFSDNGETFFGAYGPPIMDQMKYVIHSILNDRDTRQAVLTIWRQNPAPSRDIPCTVSLQWLVRRDSLYCVASMRSSDLWLGHPYDVFNFSAISFYILLELNRQLLEKGEKLVTLGPLILTAGSKHIYERNTEDVGNILLAVKESGMPEYCKKDIFAVEDYFDGTDFISALWNAAESEEGIKSLVGGR